jgi:hypothetical protein
VPSDAVVAVAVQAESDADERLAELLRVVGIQGRAGLVEDPVG